MVFLLTSDLSAIPADEAFCGTSSASVGINSSGIWTLDQGIVGSAVFND